MGFIINTIPITPGGIGVGEAAMENLFLLAGLEGGASTLLGWRIIMIVSGLIGLACYLRGKDRFVYKQPEKSATQNN